MYLIEHNLQSYSLLKVNKYPTMSKYYSFQIKFSKMFTLIKNVINVCNLIFFLLCYTLSNNFLLMKFNQFKYFYLMFPKSIKKYLRHIENLSLCNK